MWNFIQSHHPMIWGAVLMYAVSTAIGALPTPKDNSSMFYNWLFKFSNGLGAGIFRIIAIYKPEWLTALGQPPKPTIPPNPPIPATNPLEVKP